MSWLEGLFEKLGAGDRAHFQPSDFDVPLHDQVSLSALVTSAADSQLFVSKQLSLSFPKGQRVGREEQPEKRNTKGKIRFFIV